MYILYIYIIYTYIYRKKEMERLYEIMSHVYILLFLSLCLIFMLNAL